MDRVIKLIDENDEKVEIYRRGDDLFGLASPSVTKPILDVYALGNVSKDLAMSWSLPIDAIDELLSSNDKIGINRSIGSKKFGLVQFHVENALYDAPFLREKNTSNIELYRYIVGQLELFTSDRLKANLKGERDTLNECRVKAKSGIKDCTDLIAKIKDSEGQGTNLRPDNNKRRKKAQSDVELLQARLKKTLDLMDEYEGSLNDLGELSEHYIRWSNSVNKLPFNVISKNLLDVNLKDLNEEDFSSMLRTILTVGGIALEVGAFIMISIGILPAVWVSFGMPLEALGVLATGLGPVGWAIAGLLAVVGGILILISEIEKTNAYKNWYEDISKTTDENVAKVEKANTALSEQIAIIDNAFYEVNKALLSANSELKLNDRSDTMQELAKAGIKAKSYLGARKVMWAQIDKGQDVQTAASIAVDLIADEEDLVKGFKEIMITGYYIETEDYKQLKAHYLELGFTDEQIKNTLAMALLVNSNSPQEVVEKLAEIEVMVEIERVHNILANKDSLMQFSRGYKAA
ncbi:TPA: hypothetical protein I7142_16810 [Vibrio vulnificus]|uniref:hypothetical protein n=1 Tax=Vibrio vulnificus TaxID=672 RepID=UPI001865839F|nr:hypothetical protein [Vibrio vulnificus]EGR7942993.1 hypothetical protein [Vibrio vulnificus]ELV8667287.1 hypothetical protein [Vibrio vulnificus]MCU8409767.1 hypothetical protein [Vibrio vulnificus]HAS6025724.1 hypothetical protein [Vibrio vulnificus]HAS6035508.1 hypothetical protein [Vibrio vulnificus]